MHPPLGATGWSKLGQIKSDKTPWLHGTKPGTRPEFDRKRMNRRGMGFIKPQYSHSHGHKAKRWPHLKSLAGQLPLGQTSLSLESQVGRRNQSDVVAIIVQN